MTSQEAEGNLNRSTPDRQRRCDSPTNYCKEVIKEVIGSIDSEQEKVKEITITIQNEEEKEV